MTMSRIAYYATREVLPPFNEQLEIARRIRIHYWHEPAWVVKLLGPRSNTRSLA